MSKHTTGPWQAFYMPASSDKEDEHHFGLIADKNKGTFSENYANARLIAAAPELLEALQDAVRTQPADSQAKWVLLAKAAIAKATT